MSQYKLNSEIYVNVKECDYSSGRVLVLYPTISPHPSEYEPNYVEFIRKELSDALMLEKNAHIPRGIMYDVYLSVWHRKLDTFDFIGSMEVPT